MMATDIPRLAQQELSQILLTMVNSYQQMSHDEWLFGFYQIFYSQRSTQAWAATIMVEETQRMVTASQQLFKRLAEEGYINVSGPLEPYATAFAVSIHGLMDYQLDRQTAGQVVDQHLMSQFVADFAKILGESKMNERLVKACGWLGIIGLFSCASSVIFSPLAYPGYNWLAQAVSDLSATDAPSLQRWNILAAPYEIFTIVCLMMVCVAIQGKLTRPIRLGIYLFTLMNWVSNLGYKMFPLTSSGNAGTLQDFIHIYGITLAVVFLSIISLE